MVRRGSGRGRRGGSYSRQTRVLVEFFWLSFKLRLWVLERWKTDEGGIEIHLGNKTVNCLQPE